ncbi:MAG: glutathione peroxidase [Bacteroidia bacterium]
MKAVLFSFLLLLPFAGTRESVYDFTMEDIDGREVKLDTFEGKVLVIVNVASKCGLTPQYEELQQFYETYKDREVVVLGFPANNFLGQEPGTDSEIRQFCSENYGVTFPMFSKISVKGKDQHPLYEYLTQKKKNGVLDAPVKWNFQKFLVDKNGKVRQAVEPKKSILDPEVIQAVETLMEE